jgi:endoglucanase
MATSTRPPSKTDRARTQILLVGAATIVLALTLVGLGQIRSTPASALAAFSGSPVVRVSGDHLVNGSGTVVRLIGVDEAGAESACVAGEGFGIPTHPDEAQVAIARMKNWKINSVRLPLNEDCWLGINLPQPQFGGAPYRSAVVNYVEDLNDAGLAVILDLHWGAPGHQLATGGEVMADEDHSPSFWSSVATTFKSHPGVLFDLFNEPRYLPFSCLVHGGCVEDGMQVAGYDQLISDVRDAGATNVIMVAGTGYAADPTGFAKAMPHDPRGQLAISVHVYNFNAAQGPGAWARWVQLGLVSQVPFVTGELGEKDCTAKFIDTYMSWADSHGVSYLAWTFNPGACNGPSLINSRDNPTAYGAGYKAHLASLAAGA